MTRGQARNGSLLMSIRHVDGDAGVELGQVFSGVEDRNPSMAPDTASEPTGNEHSDNDGLTEDEAQMESSSGHESSNADDLDEELLEQRQEAENFLAKKAEQGQNFTSRGILVGLAIGVIICFSNTYFGLQTGWVSGMTMPAALLGFGFFKTVARCINYPFTPVENVLVQTVAGALGTMPLGCGFVGVMPALNFLLKPSESGPLVLSTWKLIIWSLGICFFGVVFAVPLRKEVIIREKLKFPSGTATALMIGVVHGNTDEKGDLKPDSGLEIFRQRSLDIRRSASLDIRRSMSQDGRPEDNDLSPADYPRDEEEIDHREDWKAKIRLLIFAFLISAFYTLFTYFVPQLRSIPIFGLPLAQKWLWSLNPSPAYVGQGIIMGPATTLHMLLGAIIGWGVLSPLAKSKGWAAGPVSDWESGSKGWIVWVSLAIMLADSIVSLSWLILRPILTYGPAYYHSFRDLWNSEGIHAFLHIPTLGNESYEPLAASEPPNSSNRTVNDVKDLPEPDSPAEHLVSTRLVIFLFVVSIVVCIFAVRYVFPPIPYGAIVLSIILALILSLMGVRALGETDLNPVSGISKITQLIFALIIPSSNPNAIIINLLAGAISESGALQAGDMMQDLKTGHLLGAAPKAQFWGQIIGSFVGAIVSAGVYKLYADVYDIPGRQFQVPTAYVWIFTARLVTGKGLPEMATQWALGSGLLFGLLTIARIRGQGTLWQAYVPGGIAVAVGMYNEPSFTLARAIGGLVNWYWRSYMDREETPIIVLASGLILGEGLVSIVNLGLASLQVPHL